MPRRRYFRLGKVKARTSLLTGKVTVQVQPGTPQIYADALWVHEQIHRQQWDSYVRKHGRLGGILRFVICRLRPACTWKLEREAYFAEISFLIGHFGNPRRVPKLGWYERLVNHEGYPPEKVKEMLDEVYEANSGPVPYSLACFLDLWWLLPH